MTTFGSHLLMRIIHRGGQGRLFRHRQETPASQFHGGRLYPNMSYFATVIKTKQKVISVNVNSMLQFENNESNLFQF